MKKLSRGITLIELLVVLAIISILALVAYAGLASARAEARKASVKASMDSLIPAAEVYYLTAGYKYTGFTVPSAVQTACTSVFSDCSCTAVAAEQTLTNWKVTCSSTAASFTWICENTGTQTYCH